MNGKLGLSVLLAILLLWICTLLLPRQPEEPVLVNEIYHALDGIYSVKATKSSFEIRWDSHDRDSSRVAEGRTLQEGAAFEVKTAHGAIPKDPLLVTVILKSGDMLVGECHFLIDNSRNLFMTGDEASTINLKYKIWFKPDIFGDIAEFRFTETNP